MQLNFVTVDVFTDRKFGGNPLAVVLNGDGLSTEQMQSIAAEFNLAETSFVLPPKDASSTARVRIFTPKAELAFAGHPNVGTAYVLATVGGRKGDQFVFEEKVGLVRVDVLREANAVAGARLAAPQALNVGEEFSAGIVAAACSLSVDDIEISGHTPRVASCGNPFVFAELKTRAALKKARPQTDVFVQHLPMKLATGFLLYTRDDTDGLDLQARMFAPLFGIVEDPATGSGIATLAGLLTSLRPERELKLSLRIGQGVDMGRPSLLDASAEKRNGEVTAISIAGRCVPMLRGTLEL